MATEHGHSSSREPNDSSAEHIPRCISSSTISDTGDKYRNVTDADHSVINVDQYQRVIDVDQYQSISTQYKQLLSAYEELGASIAQVNTINGAIAVNKPLEIGAASCFTNALDNIHAKLSEPYFAVDGSMLDSPPESMHSSNGIFSHVDERQIESAYADGNTIYKQPMSCKENDEDRHSVDGAVSEHYEQSNALAEADYDEIPVEQYYSEIAINDNVHIQVNICLLFYDMLMMVTTEL
jgi:hypothetical protein